MHVAVLGAGPVGIEFATSAIKRGLEVTLIERGTEPASNVRSWGHVRLFSSNALNFSAEGRAALASAQVSLPDDDNYPTGAELCAKYLDPLCELLRGSDKCKLLCSTEVISVSRGRLSKGKAIGGRQRNGLPFEVLVQRRGREGEERLGPFDAVVDSTGTYGNPCNMGKGGAPAVGERGLRRNGRITYTLPSLCDATEQTKYCAQGTDAPRVTAVVGAGASAITTLASLCRLGEERGKDGMRVLWITRRAPDEPAYTAIANDPLPQRAALHALGNSIAASESGGKESCVTYIPASHVLAMSSQGGGRIHVTLERGTGTDGLAHEEKIAVDNVVAHVGYRPDLSITEELQVHYCYASSAPMKLAAAMMAAGGGGGDCLAQVSPGPKTMLNPEPNFFVLGMKSYGRGSAFLLRIGHEQVAHVLELLCSEDAEKNASL